MQDTEASTANAQLTASVPHLGWQNEPDPTMRSMNPFTRARNISLRKQSDVATAIGVDVIDIMRLEQAIFGDVPQRFVEYYKKELGLKPGWIVSYKHFQHLIRVSSPRPIHGVWQFPQGELTFRRWRLHNWPTMSQTGWCKAFCIHNAALHAMEQGHQKTVSPQILNALIEANIFSDEMARHFAWRIRQAAGS